MTKTEALELLASGVTLTEAQRNRIAEVLEKAEVYGDDQWNESGEYWDESAWESSSC